MATTTPNKTTTVAPKPPTNPTTSLINSIVSGVSNVANKVGGAITNLATPKPPTTTPVTPTSTNPTGTNVSSTQQQYNDYVQKAQANTTANPYDTGKIDDLYNALQQSALTRQKQEQETNLMNLSQQQKDVQNKFTEAINNINTQRQNAGYDYTKQRNQADVINIQNQQRLQEVLANQGNYFGGENITGTIVNNTARQNVLGDINQQEQAFYNNLDLQKASAEREQAQQLANILEKMNLIKQQGGASQNALMNELEAKKIQDLMNYNAKNVEFQNTAMNNYGNILGNQLTRDTAKEQFDYQKQQDQKQMDYNIAKALGYVNPTSTVNVSNQDRARLAQYGNDYGSAIDNLKQTNPTSGDIKLLDALRNEKIFANPQLLKQYGDAYKTTEQRQLESQLLTDEVQRRGLEQNIKVGEQTIKLNDININELLDQNSITNQTKRAQLEGLLQGVKEGKIKLEFLEPKLKAEVEELLLSNRGKALANEATATDNKYRDEMNKLNINKIKADTAQTIKQTANIGKNSGGSSSSGLTKTQQYNNEINKSFGEDYSQLKSLPVDKVVNELRNGANDYIAQYGYNGYKNLWNTVLKEAIEQGQATKME